MHKLLGETLIETTVQDNEVTIVFPLVFDHKARRQFREIYESYPRKFRYIVDFGKVSMIDSSCIGTLLLLREYVGGEQGDIVLSHCEPGVREPLLAAHFEQLFRIT